MGPCRAARCRRTGNGSRRSWPAPSGDSRSSPTPRPIRLVCHPDAMTPDANPLLGPLPGVRGFWVAAGLSLNGFGGGGGIGRAMAGWITAGDPGVDVGPYRAWRFGDTIATRHSPRASPARRTPTTTDFATRTMPTSTAGRADCHPLHGRLQETGAVFGTKAGWERADHPRAGSAVAPGGSRPGRAGAGPSRPGSGASCEEARAVRERVGIIDLSSFGKIDGRGPGRARRCSSGSAANDVDRPVGSVDLQRRSSTSAAGWSPTSRSPASRPSGSGSSPVPARSQPIWPGCGQADVDEPGDRSRRERRRTATIGLWGPRARNVLGAAVVDPEHVSDAALPLRQSRHDRDRRAPGPGAADQLRR